MSNAVLVQVQTLRGNAGKAEALKAVEAAVAKYNAGAKGEQHIVEAVEALRPNTKGMQFQLALLATLARINGATMIRLSVHNGDVALCGPAKAVEATKAAMAPAYNALMTAANGAYVPSTHGNRVGFTNSFLCGAPAGMQTAAEVAVQLEYAVGYLFTFPMPGNEAAYQMGAKAGEALTGKAHPKAVPATKRKTAPKTAPAATEAPAATDAA